MKSELPVLYAAERLALRLAGAVLAVFCLLAVVPQVWRLFSPFLIAIPVAASLQPAIRFFRDRLRLNRFRCREAEFPGSGRRIAGWLAPS